MRRQACVLVLAGLILLTPHAAAGQRGSCAATRSEPAPPYYRPGAPARSTVGTGYVLRGTVRAAGTCRPVARARVELFLTNLEGEYDDDHRATVFTGRDGAYRFKSNFPRRYGPRPPHIHVIVSAAGFRRVVTQHYPRAGTRAGRFDVTLPPR
jgi:protocatechuate 3,4-dioxygenase beta subunit